MRYTETSIVNGVIISLPELDQHYTGHINSNHGLWGCLMGPTTVC